MDPVTTSLIIGISSSLAATLLFIGGSEIFRKIFLPWYADFIYKGIRIDGDWKLELNASEEAENRGQILLFAFYASRHQSPQPKPTSGNCGVSIQE